MITTRSRLLCVSLCCGVGAAAISWHGLSHLSAEPGAEGSAPVLVFTRSVEPGAILSESDVRWAAWPSHGISSGMVRRGEAADLTALQRAAIPVAFEAGDPVPRSLLNASPLGFGLDGETRALAVKLADDGAAALVRPGMVVDLILMSAARAGAPSERTLKNIRVLSVRKDAGRRPVMALVALSPRQAEIVAPYASAGQVAVAFVGEKAHAEADLAGTAQTRAETSVTLIEYGRVTQEDKPPHSPH